MNLEERAKAYNREIRDALQLLYDSITAKGQRKKLTQNPEVVALLRRYGVKMEGDE